MLVVDGNLVLMHLGPQQSSKKPVCTPWVPSQALLAHLFEILHLSIPMYTWPCAGLSTEQMCPRTDVHSDCSCSRWAAHAALPASTMRRDKTKAKQQIIRWGSVFVRCWVCLDIHLSWETVLLRALCPAAPALCLHMLAQSINHSFSGTILVKQQWFEVNNHLV